MSGYTQRPAQPNKEIITIKCAKKETLSCTFPPLPNGLSFFCGKSKINVDSGNKRGAVEAICGDHNKVYLEASTLVIFDLTDPRTLEASVWRVALALVEDLSLLRFQVASDCKAVVDEISDGSLGMYGAIIKDIQLLKRRRQTSHLLHMSMRREIVILKHTT